MQIHVAVLYGPVRNAQANGAMFLTNGRRIVQNGQFGTSADSSNLNSTRNAGDDDVTLTADTAQSATLLTWLRLMRLPTVFTALSNILCGYFLTHVVTAQQLTGQTDLFLLLLSSAGLYLGGMVLNDVCDVREDSIERPERAIPSGRISRRAAGILAATLMLSGIGAATAVGQGSLLIALILAAAVFAYDTFLKNTPAGPLGMAFCRFLNLLLGASATTASSEILRMPQLGIAAGLFIYVVGVTLFAKNEAGRSSSGALVLAMVVALAGIATEIGVVVLSDAPERARLGGSLAMALVAANLVLRCRAAWRSLQPRVIQRTVGFMLLSIIFLDASVVFAMSGNAAIAALVVILVIPASLLKRVIPLS